MRPGSPAAAAGSAEKSGGPGPVRPAGAAPRLLWAGGQEAGGPVCGAVAANGSESFLVVRGTNRGEVRRLRRKGEDSEETLSQEGVSTELQDHDMSHTNYHNQP